MLHLISGTDYWLHLDQHRRRVRDLVADAQPARLATAIRQSGSRRPRPRPSRGRPLKVRATITVHSPAAIVEAVYTDYRNWAATFPTIADVRLIGRRGSTKVLEVDHLEGKVINELTVASEGQVELWESKRHYDALFTIRADPNPAGTHLVLTGELRFKGAARLIQPFLGRYVCRQLLRLQLEPVKRRAEQRAIQIDPPTQESASCSHAEWVTRVGRTPSTLAARRTVRSPDSADLKPQTLNPIGPGAAHAT